MDDMKQVITPKSDQLNADDLLSGSITIRISAVSIRPGTEQPISVSYVGDQGKPWKPCKSMARVLVSAWGPDSSKYAGRSLTLYCDPKVKWGGMDVGGIRISHMSDIDSALTMALTITRANKKPFTVRPLVAPKESAPPATVPPADSLSPGAQDTKQAGADPSAGYITADQATDLLDRLQVAGIDKARLCKVSKVEAIGQLPADGYKRACEWILKAKESK